VGEGEAGRLVAALTSHPFSTGNTNVRVGEKEGPVDAVLYPVWRRDILEKVGLFDEDLVRNQDDDHHLRIRLAGGVIYQLPAMRARYHVRGSPARLLKQYGQYGFWKVVVARKHGRFADWKPLAPLVYFAATAVMLAAWPLWPWLGWLGAALAAVYAAADIVASLTIGSQLGARACFRALALFPALHFRYAYGMVRGVVAVYLQGLSKGEIRRRGLYAGLTR
jgi:hypothetical protein